MDGKFCFAVVVRDPVNDKIDLIGFFPRETTEQQLANRLGRAREVFRKP